MTTAGNISGQFHKGSEGMKTLLNRCMKPKDDKLDCKFKNW